MLLNCMYVNVKYYLICVKLFKNATKICYSKRQCVSASGRGLPPNPLACAVLKFSLKILWSAVLVMISNKSVSISATVRTLDELLAVKYRFLRGYPSLMPSFEGSPHPGHEICSQETRASTLSYCRNPGRGRWTNRRKGRIR